MDELIGSHAAPVRSPSGEGFDSRDFRNALGTFATGMTIITARGASGGLYGMTANSFTSVSLTPPLVLWSASLYAQSLPAFQEGSHFVVNILAYDQIELSNKFARTHDNKFAEIDHMIPECGAPVLIGAAAHFECRNGRGELIFVGVALTPAFARAEPVGVAATQSGDWLERDAGVELAYLHPQQCLLRPRPIRGTNRPMDLMEIAADTT